MRPMLALLPVNGAVKRVLLCGGYGACGALIAERLARERDVKLIIAGRRVERASQQAAELAKNAEGNVTSARLDALEVSSEELAALCPRIVINASGPYQCQNYRLARASIAAGGDHNHPGAARRVGAGGCARRGAAKAGDADG